MNQIIYCFGFNAHCNAVCHHCDHDIKRLATPPNIQHNLPGPLYDRSSLSLFPKPPSLSLGAPKPPSLSLPNPPSLSRSLPAPKPPPPFLPLSSNLSPNPPRLPKPPRLSPNLPQCHMNIRLIQDFLAHLSILLLGELIDTSKKSPMQNLASFRVILSSGP